MCVRVHVCACVRVCVRACVGMCTGALAMLGAPCNSMTQSPFPKMDSRSLQTHPEFIPVLLPGEAELVNSNKKVKQRQRWESFFALSKHWQQLLTLRVDGRVLASMHPCACFPSAYSALRPNPQSPELRGARLPHFLVPRFGQSFSAFLLDSFDQICGELGFFF